MSTRFKKCSTKSSSIGKPGKAILNQRLGHMPNQIIAAQTVLWWNYSASHYQWVWKRHTTHESERWALHDHRGLRDTVREFVDILHAQATAVWARHSWAGDSDKGAAVAQGESGIAGIRTKEEKGDSGEGDQGPETGRRQEESRGDRISQISGKSFAELSAHLQRIKQMIVSAISNLFYYIKIYKI